MTKTTNSTDNQLDEILENLLEEYEEFQKKDWYNEAIRDVKKILEGFK